jgi:hypothetical protein
MDEPELTIVEIYGAMAGMATIVGDITAPLDEEWDAARE